MIGSNLKDGGVFSPADILKEMKEITKEAETAPKAKDQRKAVETRAKEIMELLAKNGVKASGLNLLALVFMAERIRSGLEEVVIVGELFDTVLGVKAHAKVEAVTFGSLQGEEGDKEHE